MTKKIPVKRMLGAHPLGGLGVLLSHSDTHTKSGVPHRCLVELEDQRNAFIDYLRTALVRHHASADAVERERRRREALNELGLERQQVGIRYFPTNPLTQKGNLAEIALAEYITEASEATLPIYRLRYNPNVDQSMKGDDVLAFDLDSEPVRIIVGESKFRKTSTKAAVEDMVKGLIRSHKGGIPVSLQFVADRLFELGEEDLGARVAECAVLFALEKLRLDYVGLLMSDTRTVERVNQHTDNSLHRLAVISVNMEAPDTIVAPCFDRLEECI